jgi:hypothetical protein
LRLVPIRPRIRPQVYISDQIGNSFIGYVWVPKRLFSVKLLVTERQVELTAKANNFSFFLPGGGLGLQAKYRVHFTHVYCIHFLHLYCIGSDMLQFKCMICITMHTDTVHILSNLLYSLCCITRLICYRLSYLVYKLTKD